MLNPKCTICKNILHCLVDTDVNIKGSFYTQELKIVFNFFYYLHQNILFSKQTEIFN